MAMNIVDTGSGTEIIGLSTYEWLMRKAPGCARRIDRPLASSIRHINGIGSHNAVMFWVQLTLDFGGCAVVFEDVAVLPNHNGMLLGNDVFKQGNALFSFDKHVTKSGLSCDGTVTLRRDDLTPLSTPVLFSCTRSAHQSACFASADASQA